MKALRPARALLSPPVFLPWSRRWGLRLWCLAAIAAAWGLWNAFFVAPTDAAQGEVYRLLYLHVPTAWMSMFVYFVMALHCAAGWIWNTRVSWALAQGLAPVGAGYTAVALLTGSLWGQPTWGTWWVWDARLTSELLLLLLYAGVMVLQHGFEDRERGRRAAGLLAMVGLVNLPVIYFSVVWWNTLHQGATLSPSQGAQLAPAMLHALLAMAVAAWCHAAGSGLLRAHLLLRAEGRREEQFARSRDGAPAAQLQPATAGSELSPT
ncbi:cytochrome c biogenesis protein CcsA [Ramlibacter sp. USB13]|uniref:Heme exporter protein C n=1 Tax=Ramlibacter cellulosilyticus TaxID=2764187 RepID=A0A923MSG8_9BURK|nr:heme ABC transporter permease CcmC [Ramlibacter cellulosilyticus]MBC5784111.1 cytochrome c biogenesis protein CcsA [Ramlibacter cellulosilyticus]